MDHAQTPPDHAAQYRALLARLERAQDAADRARARAEAAQAELAEADRYRQEVDARAGELWVRLGQRLGRRGRSLGPLPAPDRRTLAGLDTAGLLDTVASDIGEPAEAGAWRRALRLSTLPLAGTLCGAAGYLLCWSMLSTFGITVVGVLGLVGLVLGPLCAMVLGVWLLGSARPRPAGAARPAGAGTAGAGVEAGVPADQPEPWEVLLALVPALAAEGILYAVLG